MWALVGAVKNLGDQKSLERDASTGHYSNESVAAMVDKHKTGLVFTFLIPAGSPTDIQPMSAAAKRVASTEFVPATATSAAVDPFDTEGGPWFHVSANAGADADGVPWVEAIDGVEEAIVDLEGEKATVKLSADVADDVLVSAIVEQDYEAEMMA